MFLKSSLFPKAGDWFAEKKDECERWILEKHRKRGWVVLVSKGGVIFRGWWARTELRAGEGRN